MGRDPKHDYKSRCIYHITMGKAAGCPVFSLVSGSIDQPVVTKTHIGKIIESHILNLPKLCPSLQILQYVIMPDHIHIAIFVRETLPQSVGKYIAIMKVRSLQEIRALNTGITDVFNPGFHDRRLRRCHKLKAIIEYIQKNPYRLLVRRYNPEYFKKINNIEIGGKLWQAYGNMQLLDNPFKGPVVIHRSDSEALVMAKWGRWRHLAENGGVLVSPFISQHEKMVRGMCEKVDGKVILLVNKPFGEREKPAAHDFELCAKGKLLILAPMTELPSGRETFLYLNSIAETIALPREG